MKRRTFTAHWVICLVCAGAFSFAWAYRIPQLIFASDASYMTSAIAALVVGAAVWLGWQAWRADERLPHPEDYIGLIHTPLPSSADFGREAMFLAPALGMLGTVIGLSMQAKALSAGAASLGALSTSLFTTGAGIAASLVIWAMTYSLECGIHRAQR